MSEIFLCKPCKIAREAAGRQVEMTRHSRDKGTCAMCKRRRFGDYYKPVRRWRKKEPPAGGSPRR